MRRGFRWAVALCAASCFDCTALDPDETAATGDQPISSQRPDAFDPAGGETAPAPTGGVTTGMAPGDASIAGAPPDGGGEPCVGEGALRCAPAGGGARDACSRGYWVATEPCADGDFCIEDDAASCDTIAELCIGSTDTFVCAASELVWCDSAGAIGSRQTCASARHCEEGRAGGGCAACLQGEYHCAGAELERCAPDGRSWLPDSTCDTAVLCNATAQACTDAACQVGGVNCDGDLLQRCNADRTGFDDFQQCNPGLCDANGDECDACIPGARRCEGDVAYVCNSQGQGEVPQVCASRCAGAGQCVACIAPDDCDPPANTCKRATCDSNGACGVGDQPMGVKCATGICDGRGNCTCQAHGDCPGAENLCINGACMPNRCGDGVQAGTEQCDDGNTSNRDACVAGCRNAECGDGYVRDGVEACDDGNASNTDSCLVGCVLARCGDGHIQSGVEECEASASGWLTTTCGPQCARRVYTPCSGGVGCAAGLTCGLGGCYPSGAACGSGGCPTIPGWPQAGCGLSSMCQLRCQNNTCPTGFVCGDFGAGPMCSMAYCGSDGSTDCAALGRTCQLVGGVNVCYD